MANVTRPSGNTIVEEIRQLSNTADVLEGVFRAHQQMLRPKGMNLPTPVVAGLQQLHVDLAALAQHLEESFTELQRLRALGDTTELINSTLDLSDVLNAVMDTVIDLTGAERGYLMLRNPQTKQMEFRVARKVEQRNLKED